jgi:hypothetical protein
MIIEILKFKDALEFCDALHVPEQVAVQYSDYDEIDFYVILFQPNSFKFLLKNKGFQIKARSYQKIEVALRTYDLDFVKKYIQEFKLDLNEVLSDAAWIGFTDAVKFLMSDSRVDLSAGYNESLSNAADRGHLEIVKLLLSDSRVDTSSNDNQALRNAAHNGHLEIVKLLLSDSRVDPSALDNEALRDAAYYGHTEIVKLLLSDTRVNPSAEWIEYMMRATKRENVKELLNSYLKKKQSKI